MKLNIVNFLKIAVLSVWFAGFLFAQEGSGAAAQADKAPSQQTQTVNINTADSETLQTLPRVGPVLAERIIAYRTEKGGFKTLEELKEVSGIGEKTFERLRPLISL